jgi:hypothetical protein
MQLSLSLAIRASDSLTVTTGGFNALAPRPNVIYPVSPVKAPMVVEVVMGRGVEMSVADIVGMEKMA